MRKRQFTNQQIAFALRQAEGGTPVPEVCRKMGVSECGRRCRNVLWSPWDRALVRL